MILGHIATSPSMPSALSSLVAGNDRTFVGLSLFKKLVLSSCIDSYDMNAIFNDLPIILSLKSWSSSDKTSINNCASVSENKRPSGSPVMVI